MAICAGAERQAARLSTAQSGPRHRLLLDTLAHGVALQDGAGRVLSANPAARTLLHAPEPQDAASRPVRNPGEPPVPRRPDDDLVPFPLAAEDRPAVRALRTGQVQRARRPSRSPDPAATRVGVRHLGARLDEAGSAQAVVSAVTDGTARHEQELALRRSEEMFRLVLEHAPVGIGLLALDGSFQRVNRMLCRQFGYRPDELHRRGLHDLVPAQDLAELQERIRAVVSGRKESARIERRWVGNGGMEVWGLLSLSAVRDEEGTPLHLIAQLADLSEIRTANELLTHLALHDPLTGLANRTTVLDRITKALERARTTGRRVAVLIADVDHFRVVNDSLGHERGDSVLIEVARRITGVLRPGDTAGRLSGDEYVVVCEDVVDEQEAIATAERLREAVAQPADVDGRTVVPRLSVGIALSGTGNGPGSVDPLTLLRDADSAAFRAKQDGRDRWHVVDLLLRRQAMERLDIEHALRTGLEAGQLRLHFQRIVDLGSRRVVGREALLRWHHPDRGLLGPGDFLAVAEESGLITDIGRWVLGEAARVAAKDEAEGYVSVNVSPQQVARPGLVDDVSAALADSGLAPERLMVELTESMMLSAAPSAREELALLDALGVRIVVDDFGTGFSALLQPAGPAGLRDQGGPQFHRRAGPRPAVRPDRGGTDRPRPRPRAWTSSSREWRPSSSAACWSTSAASTPRATCSAGRRRPSPADPSPGGLPGGSISGWRR